MKDFELNLQHFDDPATYTVTCYSDAGFSAFSASPASGAKNTEVTLTVTPASGYELDDIEVVAGGVTVNMKTKKFTIGEANVVLNAKSKGNKMYKITENTFCCVNGTVTNLVKNMKLVVGPNGAIVGVDCTPTDLSSLSADILAALVASGAAIKV